MFEMANSQFSPLWEPEARWAPFSAVARGELHVWGGRTANYNSKGVAGSVLVYDQVGEIWRSVTCGGDCPPWLYDGASTSSGQNMYLYGGEDGSSYHSTLYVLDTVSYKWSLLAGHSPGVPMRKIGHGIVAYSNQGGKLQLLLFGGYGQPTHPLQAGAEWVESSDKDYGWTNELHTFDLTEGKVCC